MLVLSRRLNERVFLDLPNGDRIEVVVTERNKDRFRLGFKAPKEVRIIREELEARDMEAKA